MLFNSLTFAWFLPVIVVFYFLLPHKNRWKLLLVASFYFYMCWRAEYVILLLISSLIDFFSAKAMSLCADKKSRKKYLIISLISNLSMLAGFKYLTFFNEITRQTLDLFNIFYNVPSFQILLPVGISFYTFQTLSYTIDVYRGRIEAEQNFGIFAVYVSFFPQLVAGPIERAGNLLPQFYKKVDFNYSRVTSGLRIMFWGFFKKVVIADNLADYVNIVYNNPDHFKGFVVILATIFFAFQVYCDFSGYADIAVGTAKIMGFDLTDNFKRPFFSKNMSEFWRRWHITLFDWFKDYIYIPLGGNKVSKKKHFFNIMLVFFVSGLWHGAALTFVIFGLLHGFYIVFGELTSGFRYKILTFFYITKNQYLYSFIQTVTTFCLFAFSLIFFRAQSVSDAFLLIKNSLEIDFFHPNIGFFGRERVATYFLCVIFLLFAHFVAHKQRFIEVLSQKPTWLRWTAYYFLVLIFIMYGNFGLTEFIYFRF